MNLLYYIGDTPLVDLNGRKIKNGESAGSLGSGSDHEVDENTLTYLRGRNDFRDMNEKKPKKRKVKKD